MTIRLATLDDIQTLSAIHCAALPEDLLPQLGPRFLQRFYYTYVVSRGEHACVVHEHTGSITSLAVFSRDPAALKRHLLKNPLELATRITLAAMRNWAVVPECFAHARQPWLTGCELADMRTLPELTVAATAPQAQGHGYGGAVVETSFALVSFLRAGCIVKTSSEKAERFYRQHGFEPIGHEHRGRRRLTILVRRTRVEPGISEQAG